MLAVVIDNLSTRAAQVGKLLDHSGASHQKWGSKLDVELPEMLLLRFEDAGQRDNGALAGVFDERDGLRETLGLEEIQHDLLNPFD